MFSPRSLDDDLDAVREDCAPGSPVLDVDADFETVPPAAAEDLGLFVDGLSPASFPTAWLPDEAPETLRRYAGPTFTVGLPGDGTVVRTTQTDPQAVLVKKRAEGTPDDFLAFLIAERLVQIGVSPPAGSLPDDTSADRLPESFLPFFGERYVTLDSAVGSGPADVYQVAAALYDAWVGLQTREVFREWDDEYPDLYDAWDDAGGRLSGRLADLPAEVARGRTSFAAATEYACSAVKHDLDLPVPFAALDTGAYLDHGAEYAVRWAEKTFEQLRADD